MSLNEQQVHKQVNVLCDSGRGMVSGEWDWGNEGLKGSSCRGLMGRLQSESVSAKLKEETTERRGRMQEREGERKRKVAL